MFQYISCYSLSYLILYFTCNCSVSIHLMLLFIQKRLSAEWMAELFQYISCYSLSEYGNLKKLQKSCFNTSHVTLYRVKTQLRADHPRSFNTSHVTLYPSPAASSELPGTVSIHLMLLFIPCD